MQYVISDIHGCYEKYIQLLEHIKFTEKDTLYVLGDIIDRGNDGLKIMFDMMNKENIIPILGNHEYMAYRCLKRLSVEITADNYDTYLDEDILKEYALWANDGGDTTAKDFRLLSSDDKDSILNYIEEFSLYEEVEVNGNSFVLLHAGLSNFSLSRKLEEYHLHEMIFERMNFEDKYYDDKIIVTGHTPTFLIDEKYRGKIYKKNNCYAIDCGVVYGEKLGCLCLDTLEEYYV